MKLSILKRSCLYSLAAGAFFILTVGSIPLAAREMSLDEALNIALHRTSRGDMIEGNLEVARQYYSARRINMYLPEISINGTLPTYAQDESYRPYSNPLDRQLYEERNLDFNSFIELNQSLITGGSLTATADLTSNDRRYPNTLFPAGSGMFVDQVSQAGRFNFTLEQPLFRPSSVKNELHNRQDDLEIARMTKIEEEAVLKKEVTEAYLTVLQLTIKHEKTSDQLRKASLQEEIDSAKLSDGVLSEEDYLLSSAARLDAELEHFSVQTDLEEQKRELATLLDLDVSEPLDLTDPVPGELMDEHTRDRLIAAWDLTVPIKKAKHQFEKSKREADYAAAGHGLTGDLNATYSLGRQKIETDRTDASGVSETYDENINTSGWSVALQFRLPVWDGGAGGAAVKAARYQSQQAEYEYTRAQRSARAQILNLINQLEVSHKRLSIVSKQIELAENRLNIAKDRQADGQISMLTLLESRIFYLETRDQYLEELKAYLVNSIELQGKFVG
ncbi:MAG: TolC family protein [bacterium]|nr:TolC family protein [bacterium]